MASPACIISSMGLSMPTVKIVNITVRIMVIRTVWHPALSASSLSFAPIALAISELPPEPIAFPTPPINMYKGAVKPVAAIAFAPIPAIHMLSVKL